MAFIMTVGISGSGKSTYAKPVKDRPNTVYLSSDEIRKELWGDENDQREPARVFALMEERTIAALEAKKDVIYDATNLSAKRRASFLKRIKPNFPMIIFCCTVVVAPVETCIQRAADRQRVVPAEVVLRQLAQFQMPTYDEGWDIIFRRITVDREEADGALNSYFTKARRMNHDNPHHPDTIGEHSVAVGKTMMNSGCPAADKTSLYRIGLWHDIGKIFTKTVKADGTAHYFGHENASAYIYLLLDIEVQKLCKEAAVIGWHMRRFSYASHDDYVKWLATHTEETIVLLNCLVSADNEHSI